MRRRLGNLFIPVYVFSVACRFPLTELSVWIAHLESFFCTLDECSFDQDFSSDRNSSTYGCNNIHCSCVPSRTLCGEAGGVDITEFLETVKGPALFTSLRSRDGADNGSRFSEPAMNGLIQAIFGDRNIFLDCHSGECVHKTELPGYSPPIKTINTPLIAVIIAVSALFVVAVSLLLWYLSRRSYYANYAHLAPSDDDESDHHLAANQKPVALQFDNVSYAVNGKAVLDGIHGLVHPGEVMAIIGASGAGKTSFLDILARKNKRGLIAGDFYLNGEQVSDDDYRSLIGFVDQDDTLMPTLTAHETILTSALLRLPRDMPYAAKEQRVADVERQLGIHHIRDQLIGSDTDVGGRGISGGEKRRVAIACELVTSPSLLFLDEPTSGLDAYNAYNVVDCLVSLAKESNRTIVFTIHQPRSNIVALFDRLVLLAAGRTVYSGPLSHCQPYFDSLGYVCPPGFNIADYLVDLTMNVATPSRVIVDDPAARTRSSSLRAVKSVASMSVNSSAESAAHPPTSDSSIRTVKGNPRMSSKKQQERQLLSRRKTPPTPGNPLQQPTSHTEDEESSATVTNTTPQSIRLGLNPEQHTAASTPGEDDPDDVLPSAATVQTDLSLLIDNYAQSNIASAIRDEIKLAVANAASANGQFGPIPVSGTNGTQNSYNGYKRIGYFRQFLILSQRTWRNLYRNPQLMLMHYAVAIVLAVLSGYLFYGLTDDIKGFQNRLGLFFFLLALFGFSTLTSLTVFSSERLLFTRERANGYYHPVTYFASKVVFDIVPLRLIPPILMGVIIYPMVGLIPAWPEFSVFMLILVLFNLASATICLCIGIVFWDGGVANLVGSLVMLFSLLFAGLLLNHDAIPKAALWLQSVIPPSSLSGPYKNC